MDPPVPVVPSVPHAPSAFCGGAVRRGYAVGGRSRGRGGLPIRAAVPVHGGDRASVGPHRARRPAVRGRGTAVRAAPAATGVDKSWGDPDVGNPLPAFTPRRPPGVHFPRPLLRRTMTKAVEFFQLFFSTEMINSICNHTNSYANECIFEGTHTSYTKKDGSWEDTTPDEIRRLIALLIYFGLVRVGNFNLYWSVKTLYHGLWARRIMTKLRYQALMAFLYVVDPGNENPNEKLHMVESFIAQFKTKCLSLYQPYQNMAVDERMVKSRHRSGMRQYIKDKPTKWGIKLWVLADSCNGYTVDFDVYTGKAAGRNVSDNGIGYDVVMKLITPFLNQGYRLFFDNFYTSVNLVKHLFER